MISIGVIFGGPTSEVPNFDRLVKCLAVSAKKLRDDSAFGSIPAVNVVFHVPGSVFPATFDDIREGKFSRKKKLLMVQVPIPKEQLESDDLLDFLIHSLHMANAFAFHFFEKRGMTYPLRDAETLVERIGKRARVTIEAAQQRMTGLKGTGANEDD